MEKEINEDWNWTCPIAMTAVEAAESWLRTNRKDLTKSAIGDLEFVHRPHEPRIVRITVDNRGDELEFIAELFKTDEAAPDEAFAFERQGETFMMTLKET